MKHKKITQKDILSLSISVFAVVVAWIAFSLYHSFVTTTISNDLQMKIVPIDPKFDMATLQLLKSREKVLPLFQTDTEKPASIPATLTPTPKEAVIIEGPTVTPPDTASEPPLNEGLTTETPTPAAEPTITP